MSLAPTRSIPRPVLSEVEGLGMTRSTIAGSASILQRAEASVPPPHVARQNIQLGPVLGDGASRDRNAALAQNLDDLLVAKRRVALLALDQIEDCFFHAGVAH